MASRCLCRLLGRKRWVEIIRYSLVSAVFLRVLWFSIFGSQGVTNLTTSRPKSSSKAVIEIYSKTASGSATVTASFPKQSIALTRSASVPFKKQKTKPLEHNHYKLNQRAYKASFLSSYGAQIQIWQSRRAYQNNSLAKTTVTCLEKIGQRALTKAEKTLERIQIYSL